MNGITRTLFLGLGAAGAALILSVPATAAESAEARDGRHRFAQVDAHRGHGHYARSEFRGRGIHSGPRLYPLRIHRVHYRGHYRHGHRYWRGNHWRRYHRRGHRPYWRLYRNHPRYGHR